MKYFPSFVIITGILLAGFSQPAFARPDKISDTVIYDTDSVKALDAAQEAHKIRQLVKLALANDAPAASHQVLSEEIALVEKNGKLKKNVMARLLQDDDPDPTLPKVTLARYPNGSERGLLFIQAGPVRNNTPNRLAWPYDMKRESKESSR